MNKILILGASGFIGNTLYKELQPYFDVFGTYCHENDLLEQNQIFYKFDVEKDNILDVLKETNPNFIISALKGNFEAVFKTHQSLVHYVSVNKKCKLLYISCNHVFDGADRFPSYESDPTLSESTLGKFKISIEKLINELPKNSFAILRIPLVLGVNSPTMSLLKRAIQDKTDFDVFPNLIITVTTARKIAQQIHYIVNKKLTGIYHLASTDLVHHEDLITEITSKLSEEKPVFKRVYSRNEDSYQAILPKENKLPKQYRITIAEVIKESTLNEEINLL